MAISSVGPTGITYTVSPADGSMTVTATQVFADGSTSPLHITISAYKVALYAAVVATYVNPTQYVVPNGAPSNADVARLIATIYTINNAPDQPVAAAVPTPVAVPSVTITTGS